MYLFNSLHAGDFLTLLLSSDFFSKSNFYKNFFHEHYIRVSNGLDPNQDLGVFDPHLSPVGRQMAIENSASNFLIYVC